MPILIFMLIYTFPNKLFTQCQRSECSQSRRRRSLQFVEQTFDVAAAPVFVNEFVDVKYANSGWKIIYLNGNIIEINENLSDCY